MADVRVLDPRQQGELLYLLAYLSKNEEQKAVTAQFVVRQRDERMRLRIIYDLPVLLEQNWQNCLTMRVGSKAKWENLAKKLIYELSEYENKTAHSTLRLSFTGQEAAARVVQALERSWRKLGELCFSCQFQRMTSNAPRPNLYT